jgi:hypothetical protein
MRIVRRGVPLIGGSVVLSVLLWGSAWVAQGSGAQSQSTNAQSTENPSGESSLPAKHKPQKERHWSGSLVDVNCMAKAGQTGSTDEKLGSAEHWSTTKTVGC